MGTLINPFDKGIKILPIGKPIKVDIDEEHLKKSEIGRQLLAIISDAKKIYTEHEKGLAKVQLEKLTPEQRKEREELDILIDKALENAPKVPEKYKPKLEEIYIESEPRVRYLN